MNERNYNFTRRPSGQQHWTYISPPNPVRQRQPWPGAELVEVIATAALLVCRHQQVNGQLSGLSSSEQKE